MRKLALSALVALAGCGGSGVWSPSDPRTFDRTMFSADAMNKLPEQERPYVMGHAIGVYLYGKTLPKYVDGHYLYRPGLSSPKAEIPYNWEHVLIARSGGDDGNGGAIYDDVGVPGPDQHGGSNDPGPGSDDVPDPGDGGGGDTCGQIDVQCGSFLNPAADDARALATEVDPARFADDGLLPADLATFEQEFDRGLEAALAEADRGELAGFSEVTFMKSDAIDIGLCAQ